MNGCRPLKIAIIGAGNVATHLAHAFIKANHEVVAVMSRSGKSAVSLAASVGAEAVESTDKLPANCDLVVIATNDSAVKDVANSLPRRNWMVVHTSGSVPLDIISSRHKSAGVLYPLQTFTRDVEVDINAVPFFIEASDDDTAAQLKALASEISSRVEYADSERRRVLHVAGVLASNFPIYMLQLCAQVLSDAGLPLSTVEPLVKAGIQKAFSTSPDEALTGPARRGDVATIKKQLDFLGNSDAGKVYALLSSLIMKKYNKADLK